MPADTAPPPGWAIEKRAIEMARALLDKMGIAWNEQDDDCGILATEFTTAMLSARREALEEAACLVDHHPFADEAGPGCEDAQGCCEMMAAAIRALADRDPQPGSGGEKL